MDRLSNWLDNLFFWSVIALGVVSIAIAVIMATLIIASLLNVQPPSTVAF